MAQSTKPHPFNADRPITVRADDRLGRTQFAESLADAIAAWKEHDSLVIGLFGQWGQGKTSTKNLVLDVLNEAHGQDVSVVEFNPWQWSNQSQIAQAFFSEIAATLGMEDKDAEATNCASKWRLYAAALSFAEKTTSGLKKGIPVILASLAVAFGSSAVLTGQTARITFIAIAATLTVLAGVFRVCSGLAEDLAKLFEEHHQLKTRTLGQIRRDLQGAMSTRTRPLLVVIDDIDRLTPTEIRLVFQLVKSNADFPNMVYLLLFQRDLIEKALEQPPSTLPTFCGRDYLEKIVNVGFDLPTLDPTRVSNYFIDGLNKIVEGINIDKTDTERFTNLYAETIRLYIQNLRHAKRILSNLDFHLGLLRSKDTTEVNPTDLIALEVLRVFEPDVYAALPGMKDYLTTTLIERREDAQRKELTAALESILSKCSTPDHKGRVQSLLTGLFPVIETINERFAGGYSTNNYQDEYYRTLRVCHPDVFNRYFLLKVADGDVSQADIERVLTVTGDREKLASELRSFHKQGLLPVLLDRLEAYKQKIEISHAVPLATAICDVADEIPQDKQSTLFTPLDHARRIIHWHLKREQDQTRRGEALVQATTATTGLVLPTIFAMHEDRKSGQKKASEEYLIDEANSERLKEIVVEKIGEAAANNTLLTRPHLKWQLHGWRKWGDPTKPPAWLKDQINDPSSLLAILKAFAYQSSAQTIGSRATHIRWYFDLKNLEDYVDAATVEQKVRILNTTNLGEDEQRTLQAFARVMKLKHEGKPYDSDNVWLHDEKED